MTRQRVQVIDDNAINLALFQALLAKLPDCESVAHADAQAGLAWAREHRPDLIVLDYMMPGLDGVQLLQSLRQTPGCEELPVLMTAMFLISLLVFMMAAFGFLLERDAQPDKFENIPQSIYWAVVTLASVGYGDISPVTPMGRALTVVLALLGLAAGVAAPRAMQALEAASERGWRNDVLARIESLPDLDGVQGFCARMLADPDKNVFGRRRVVERPEEVLQFAQAQKKRCDRFGREQRREELGVEGEQRARRHEEHDEHVSQWTGEIAEEVAFEHRSYHVPTQRHGTGLLGQQWQ